MLQKVDKGDDVDRGDKESASFITSVNTINFMPL